MEEELIVEQGLDNRGMFRRPFSFKGRIRRLEYGISYIIYIVWYVVTMLVLEESEESPLLSILAYLSIIACYWFLLAQGVKRCHDRGNSGWYLLIPFYILFMLFGKGEEGINEYGNNPKNKKYALD